MLALLAQAPTGYPGGGPGDLERLLSVFYILFGSGFVIAVIGHLAGSRTLVMAGIILVFLGTAAFFVAVGTHG